MRIALPMAGGRLSPHFGRCEGFILIDIDPETRQITGRNSVQSPVHAPGAFPALLAEHGVTHVLASGMGPRAVNLFTQHGIEVVIGALSDDVEQVVAEFLEGNLQTGESPCDHDEGHGCTGSDG
jgi:predicted Fe-Mo cluster-binding NifX family protein